MLPSEKAWRYRRLARAEHGERLAGLPDGAVVVAVECGAVVVGPPLDGVGTLRPHDALPA